MTQLRLFNDDQIQQVCDDCCANFLTDNVLACPVHPHPQIPGERVITAWLVFHHGTPDPDHILPSIY